MLINWTRFLIHRRKWCLPLLIVLWLAAALWLRFNQEPVSPVRVAGASYSDAAWVQRQLHTHFGVRQDSVLALILEQAAPTDLLKELTAFPQLQEIREIKPQQSQDSKRHHLYLLQLNPAIPEYLAQLQVPVLRQKLANWREKTGLKSWLAGQPAFFYDATQAGKHETSRFEKIGLLLAFVVLIRCFGSLVTAFLPILIGLTTLLFSQALIRFLHLPSDQTSLILNSMVGLALAIDYCLFMVSRYREERQQHEPLAAIQTTLFYTGRTVLYSTAIMLSALLTLLIPEVLALRDTVQTMVLVVCLAAFNAVVILPWLLVALDGVLDRPRWLSLLVSSWQNDAFWRRWATHVTAHPIHYGLFSLTILVALAWPAHQLKIWEPMQSLAPGQSESVQGFEALLREGWGGEVLPVQILIELPPGQSAWEPEILKKLYQMTSELQALPEVAAVQGLVSTYQPLEYYVSLYRQFSIWQVTGLAPEIPLWRQTEQGQLLSTFVYQKNLMQIEDTYRILDWAKDYQARHPEIKMAAGGVVARAHSFTIEMYRHVPLMMSLILGVILVLLSFYLSSWILPIKAGIMNFMPIASAFGILVWAFQWNAGRPGITNLVPMILFCIVFGLSMDYEVLILSRIDEAWRQSGNVRQAVVTGLSQSSGMITGAALILLGVFAPGIWSSSQVVKEISLGISATIVLDATLVRLLLVPSLMMLMGRWNWWKPGYKR